MLGEEKLHGYDVIHIHFDEHLTSLLFMPFILFDSSFFIHRHIQSLYLSPSPNFSIHFIYRLILILYSLLYLMRCIHLNRWCEKQFIDDSNRNYAEKCYSGFCSYRKRRNRTVKMKSIDRDVEDWKRRQNRIERHAHWGRAPPSEKCGLSIHFYIQAPADIEAFIRITKAMTIFIHQCFSRLMIINLIDYMEAFDLKCWQRKYTSITLSFSFSF